MRPTVATTAGQSPDYDLCFGNSALVRSCMSQNDWGRRFDDPITLPEGRTLRTLRDVGEFITALPKAQHDRPEWQLAVAMLLQAAEAGGIVMLARIALMRAINVDKPDMPPEPGGKHAKAYNIIR